MNMLYAIKELSHNAKILKEIYATPSSTKTEIEELHADYSIEAKMLKKAAQVAPITANIVSINLIMEPVLIEKYLIAIYVLIVEFVRKILLIYILKKVHNFISLSNMEYLLEGFMNKKNKIKCEKFIQSNQQIIEDVFTNNHPIISPIKTKSKDWRMYCYSHPDTFLIVRLDKKLDKCIYKYEIDVSEKQLEYVTLQINFIKMKFKSNRITNLHHNLIIIFINWFIFKIRFIKNNISFFFIIFVI